MASASESQQLAAVAAAELQCDVVTIARLTRATSVSVCEAACLALANLSENSLLRTALASDQTQAVVKALTSALRTQRGLRLQRECCRALGNLCSDMGSADAVSTFAGTCGAVEAVAAALRAHRTENADVQEAECLALANLLGRGACMYHTGNCDRAHRAGGWRARLHGLAVGVRRVAGVAQAAQP